MLVKLFLLVEATCQPFSEEVIFFLALNRKMLYRLDFDIRHYIYTYIHLLHIYDIFIFICAGCTTHKGKHEHDPARERRTLNSLFTQCCDQYRGRVLNICHQTITH